MKTVFRITLMFLAISIMMLSSDKTVSANDPRDCYNPPCYRYTPPTGIRYNRWFYNPRPLYRGYWPGMGYYYQYPYNYDPRYIQERTKQRYMRCSQSDMYYHNCY